MPTKFRKLDIFDPVIEPLRPQLKDLFGSQTRSLYRFLADTPLAKSTVLKFIPILNCFYLPFRQEKQNWPESLANDPGTFAIVSQDIALKHIAAEIEWDDGGADEPRPAPPAPARPPAVDLDVVFAPVVDRPAPTADARSFAASLLDRYSQLTGLLREAYTATFGAGVNHLIEATRKAIRGHSANVKNVLYQCPCPDTLGRGIQFFAGRTYPLPCRRECGYAPEADVVAATLASSLEGFPVGEVILQHPSAVTGAGIPPGELEEIVRRCDSKKTDMIVDESGLLGWYPGAGKPESAGSYTAWPVVVTRVESVYPELSGQCEGLAVAFFPDFLSDRLKDLPTFAADTHDGRDDLAARVGRVAAKARAFDLRATDPWVFDTRLAATGRLTRYLADRFRELGLHCPRPDAGTRLWVDFSAFADGLGRYHLETPDRLQAFLRRSRVEGVEEFGVHTGGDKPGVIPGVAIDVGPFVKQATELGTKAGTSVADIPGLGVLVEQMAAAVAQLTGSANPSRVTPDAPARRPSRFTTPV